MWLNLPHHSAPRVHRLRADFNGIHSSNRFKCKRNKKASRPGWQHPVALASEGEPGALQLCRSGRQTPEQPADPSLEGMQQWGRRQGLQLAPIRSARVRPGGSGQREVWAQDRLLSSWFPTIILLYSFCCSSLKASFTFSLFRPPSLGRGKLHVRTTLPAHPAPQPLPYAARNQDSPAETKVPHGLSSG